MPCDNDSDGDCDIADYRLVMEAVGICSGKEGFNSLADADGDGCVTDQDVYRLFPNGPPSPSTSQNQIDTSNWKTYRNEKYGFEVEYPPTCNIYLNEVFKTLPTPACLFIFVREESK